MIKKLFAYIAQLFKRKQKPPQMRVYSDRELYEMDLLDSAMEF